MKINIVLAILFILFFLSLMFFTRYQNDTNTLKNETKPPIKIKNSNTVNSAVESNRENTTEKSSTAESVFTSSILKINETNTDSSQKKENNNLEAKEGESNLDREERDLNGVPEELFERYETSSKGTTKEGYPPYLFVLGLMSLSEAERTVIDKMSEERLVEFKIIKENQEKLSSEELELKYKKLNQFYEKYFLSVLDTEQKKQEFIKFVEYQIKSALLHKERAKTRRK